MIPSYLGNGIANRTIERAPARCFKSAVVLGTVKPEAQRDEPAPAVIHVNGNRGCACGHDLEGHGNTDGLRTARVNA
jgi:hypothetical protein